MYFWIATRHAIKLQGDLYYSLVTNILQNMFFCAQENKETHTTWNNIWEGVNNDRIFIFGWTIPLNVLCSPNNLNIIIFVYIF